MRFIPHHIEGLYTVQPVKLGDDRGFFARTFCKQEFAKIGFTKEFVQFNHSFNKQKGTIRGLHFQQQPFTEVKLIRCIQGAVFDVAVDLRAGSPTYLQYFAAELSAENMVSILIPDGFAHGFQVLEDNTSLIYHHTQYYTPQADSGIRYNDPSVGITWPLPAETLSTKDLSYNYIDHTFKGITL